MNSNGICSSSLRKNLEDGPWLSFLELDISRAFDRRSFAV